MFNVSGTNMLCASEYIRVHKYVMRYIGQRSFGNQHHCRYRLVEQLDIF